MANKLLTRVDVLDYVNEHTDNQYNHGASISSAFKNWERLGWATPIQTRDNRKKYYRMESAERLAKIINAHQLEQLYVIMSERLNRPIWWRHINHILRHCNAPCFQYHNGRKTMYRFFDEHLDEIEQILVDYFKSIAPRTHEQALLTLISAYDLGLSQKVLAQAIGCDASLLSCIRKGTRTMTDDIYGKIMEVIKLGKVS